MEYNDKEKALLDFLGGDEVRLRHYLNILATCRKPYDVADRVVKPIFLNEGVGDKTLGMKSFYGVIADLAPKHNGMGLNHKSLYYHINGNLGNWVKEKREMQKEEEDFYVDHTVKVNADGSMDYILHAHGKLDKEMFSQLAAYIRKGDLKMLHKLLKNFDARGDCEITEFRCSAGLMPAVLITLQETCGDITVTYQSPYTRQENITLDEAMEIFQSENDEEQVCL